MPYNSSAFEKQLAKYKAAEGAKKVAEMPASDRERKIVAPLPSYLKDGGSAGGALRDDQKREALAIEPVIVVSRRKPLYKRAWFAFMLLSVASAIATPVVFKDEMRQLMGVVDTVKTTTGVDPLSLKTYTGMIKGTPVVNPVAPAQSGAGAEAMPSPAINPMDMQAVMEAAQQRAQGASAQGAEHSMKYIEEETRRLQEMARELEQQQGR